MEGAGGGRGARISLWVEEGDRAIDLRGKARWRVK